MGFSHRILSIALLLVCAQFYSASASDSAKKVTLSLYYESLCPYSASFIVNQLDKIFSDGLISIIDLQLFPYGNAQVLPGGDIICQHGFYECLLNTVEACAIDAWPIVTEHFKFINCVEELVVEGTYTQWKTCFDKLGLDSEFVLNCSSGAYGKQLEYEYGDETDALVPPHQYVPWVVVNGRPLYDDYDTFGIEVCKAYQGELPKACQEYLSGQGSSVIKTVKEAQVSYRDQILSRVLSE